MPFVVLRALSVSAVKKQTNAPPNNPKSNIDSYGSVTVSDAA